MAAQKYSPEPERFISVAEYLEFEARSGIKHEYLDGRIRSMAGGSSAHSLITLNISADIRSQIRGSGCRSYSSDMRVHVPGTELYCYPDAAFVCGEPEYNETGTILLNPTVIIEVLSLSTESHDRTEKWLRYQRLASLRDYLLVAQHAPIIEHYALQDGGWRYFSYEGLEAAFELSGARATVRLSEVYENIAFERAGDRD